MFQISKQLKTSLLFFGIAALLGSYLRAFPLLPSWANYKFILHTHSHIALIGWVYLFLSGLIVERYTNYLNSPFYKILYKTSIVSIIGMMLSFPIQGYALWSIVFSTLFLVVSYLLLYWILKSKNDFAIQSTSFKFIKSGLYYLAISSIGPWALGLIMAVGGKETIWYQLSVYFYLHFQYNGWMLFGLFGLFYALLETENINCSSKSINRVYRLLHLGVILSFCANVLWTHPPLYMHFLTALGGIFLLWTLLHPYRIIRQHLSLLQPIERFLLTIISGLLILKSIGLISLGLPWLSDLLHQHKDLIIAYIHMNFIGVVSLSLLWFAYKRGYFGSIKKALVLFLTGFFVTEVLLLIRSTQLVSIDFNLGLSLGSLAIAIGIIALMVQLKTSDKK